MIYVLLLEQEKMCVGFSARPIGPRFLEHFVLQQDKLQAHSSHVHTSGTKEDEDDLTLRLMEDYGWWNVRVGKGCQVDMSSPPEALLHRQKLKLPPSLIRHRGESLTGPIRSQRPVSSGSSARSGQRPIQSRKRDRGLQKRACARCGRDSHTAERCFAKMDVDGDFFVLRLDVLVCRDG